MDTFFTIGQACKGEYKENKSSFLAFAYPVEKVEEVKEKIDNLKKEYYDARHHCYAYRIGMGKEVLSRAFDDREPSHTAGERILGAIESRNLTNVLIVVVRYFGGIKLGASNLAKAYRQASLNALDESQVIERKVMERIVFDFDFSVMNQINKLLKDNRLDKEQYSFLSANSIQVFINKDKKESILSQLKKIYGVNIKNE